MFLLPLPGSVIYLNLKNTTIGSTFTHYEDRVQEVQEDAEDTQSLVLDTNGKSSLA